MRKNLHRRAPKGGYAFDAKAEYRNAVWKAFRSDPFLNMSTAQALLMPSAEGIEIEVAIKKGFRVENLHIVDYNPAIVATLKRRYPKINTYGVSVARACERIAKKGLRLSCANFDFTGCLSLPLIREIEQIRESGAIAPGAKVAITLLRGREQPNVFAFLSEAESAALRRRQELHGDERDISWMAEHCDALPVDGRKPSLVDAWRMARATFALGDASDLLRTGVYKSGTQTMLWWVAKVYDAAQRIQEFEQAAWRLIKKIPPTRHGSRHMAAVRSTAGAQIEREAKALLTQSFSNALLRRTEMLRAAYRVAGLPEPSAEELDHSTDTSHVLLAACTQPTRASRLETEGADAA